MDQDLKVYLDEQFGNVNERFAKVDERFETMDQQFAKVNERFTAEIEQLRKDTQEQFRDLKDDVRRAYVLIEDLRDNVKLVGAEGVASVREQLTERQEEISKKLGEVETFNRDSYKDLRRSYDDLDSRVRTLESNR